MNFAQYVLCAHNLAVFFFFRYCTFIACKKTTEQRATDLLHFKSVEQEDVSFFNYLKSSFILPSSNLQYEFRSVCILFTM